MPHKILIVDDEISLREVIVDFLNDKEYVIEQAGTGKEALRQIDFFMPHLVLLDMVLPDMSGLEVLEKTRKKHPQIPVILLSGLHEEEAAKKAIELGAYDYLVKPFSLETLEENFIKRILS